MMVRGEPEYVDQVPRRTAYEAAHPNLEIIYLAPCWQAVFREDTGETIITRHSLKALLDKLEALDETRMAQSVTAEHQLPVYSVISDQAGGPSSSCWLTTND